MSVINQIFAGSLLSAGRLIQAREFYCPTRTLTTPELAFAKWTQRVTVQTELGSAREIAGLSDDELAPLELEFVRCPVRRRSDRVRHTVPGGGVLVALGGLGLILQAMAGVSEGAQSMLQLLSVVCLMAGVSAVTVGALAAFRALPLDLSHGTTGLYVGLLDEQHPWLYKTMNLTVNAGAEDYRQRVLRERGPLRGVDYVLMRALVRAHDAMEETRSARSVAEQIQLHAAPGEAGMRAEPRLIPVASRSELRHRVGAHSAS